MVIFDTDDAARHADGVIEQAKEDLKAHPEFKFNKTADAKKVEFFERVLQCDFRVRAIVVRKEAIYSDRLKSQKEEFYRYFVKSMVRHDDGVLENAKIVIDGSGERIFRADLQSYLRRSAGTAVRSVKFTDSRKDHLVQLADMCVGAIARSYRADRKDAAKWRVLLERKIADVW